MAQRLGNSFRDASLTMIEAPDRKPSPLAQTSADFVPANKLNKGSDCATTLLRQWRLIVRERSCLAVCCDRSTAEKGSPGGALIAGAELMIRCRIAAPL